MGKASMTWRELIYLAFVHGKNDMYESSFKEWLSKIAKRSPGMDKAAMCSRKVKQNGN